MTKSTLIRVGVSVVLLLLHELFCFDCRITRGVLSRPRAISGNQQESCRACMLFEVSWLRRRVCGRLRMRHTYERAQIRAEHTFTSCVSLFHLQNNSMSIIIIHIKISNFILCVINVFFMCSGRFCLNLCDCIKECQILAFWTFGLCVNGKCAKISAVMTKYSARTNKMLE